MIDRVLSHYRVVEHIGQGGMGSVYRARDQHLDRDVALKVLPEGAFANDATRRRFRREAQALSRLNHPNIATVFDFDTESGLDFLVMEFVEGETLSARIARAPFQESEARTLGIQIADALEVAHEQGIVHRDLKPGNVMVTKRGQAKVLDFGLAKLLAAEQAPADRTRASTTETGMVVGTLSYMSPEQLLGTEVDARADVYAMGALLYEMLTGRCPFEASTSTALVHSIIVRAPAPPGRYRPDLSTQLETVVLKCLDKDRESRYQSARELAVDLRRAGESSSPAWTAPPAVGGRIDSIAVLPLENLSGDPEQEYFADGMTEALIADLARLPLRVISRTSVMRFKRTTRPLPEVARELRVDSVVEGSVLRAGGRVRISAQLIEAATDRHLWADSYERDLGDVLGLQREVARAIVNEINLKLTPQEEARLASLRPVAPEAHEAYLKGRFCWNKRSVEWLRKALEHFRRANEIDPGYAPGFAGLADCYILLGGYGAMPPAEAFPKAKAAATRALEMDGTLGEAHASRACALWLYDRDAAAAEAGYRRALETSPGYATAHHWFAVCLATLRRFEEALARARQAHELDPLSLPIVAFIGSVYHFAGRRDEAIRQYRSALEMDANFVPAHLGLSDVYAATGDHARSIEEACLALRLSGEKAQAEGLARDFAASGYEGAMRGWAAALSAPPDGSPVVSGDLAILYARCGDADLAMEWLERAFEERSAQLVYLNVEPGFDRVRSDPRFVDLVRRVGLPPA